MNQELEFIENTPIAFNERLNLPEISLHTTYHKGFSSPNDPSLDAAHIHDDYEIYLHVSGDCSFFVNNSLYPIKCGDIILTRPGDVHFLIINQPSVSEHFCLWFDPACGKELFDFIEGDFCPLVSFPAEKSDMLVSLFFKLADQDSLSSGLEKISMVLQIILALSQKSQTPVKAPQSIPNELQEILDYVDLEFSSIAHVSDICEKFNLSASTLGRWFKKHLQISPREFLKAKRLSAAKRMLDMGVSVTESCMRAGFSDCSYFISVFKQKFGITPYQYQRR